MVANLAGATPQRRGVNVTDGTALRHRFGNRVAKTLADLGLTPSDLAAKCSLPVGRVENILKGQLARITLRDMALIASVLGTPLANLMIPIEAAIAFEAFEIAE